MSIIKKIKTRCYKTIDSIHGQFDPRSTEVLIEEEIEKHLKGGDAKTIIYVGIKFDYGNKDWGLSYEHYNFYHTLLNMDVSLIYFDYDRINQKYGVMKTSEMLRELVYLYHPYYVFYFHFHDWISHDVWNEISTDLPTKTIIWLADDHWRYEETEPVWKLFNLVVTTDKNGYERRMDNRFENVLLSQWGCNHFLYKNLKLPKIHDVSFVGQSYGARKNFIETLENYGLNVATFGRGWKNSDRISQADLIKIYNQSKITLNISFASKDDKIQIKGRDFEAPGCGSLLCTADTDEIANYFIPENEIITYTDADDAAKKIKYYLENDSLREEIASNGYNRIMGDHTVERRISRILEIAKKL